MKIICISDTHNRHRDLDIPIGDILIHAGDFTEAGTLKETEDFLNWFGSQPHKHKIFIAGNHDFLFQNHSDKAQTLIPSNVHYLEDEKIIIENITFFGSPYTPGNGNWAFNESWGSAMNKHWNLIPKSTDFLITHGPAFGILDELDNKRHIGCDKLLSKINILNIPYHLFGHVHNDYGIVKTKKTLFINCSSLDNSLQHVNAALVVHHKDS